LPGKKVPEPGGDEARGLGLSDDHLQHVLAFIIASFAENGLFTLIVQVGAIGEPLPRLVQRPTGQRAGGFGNVLLRVVPFSQGKEFHHFAREVLVRMLLAALGLVQINEHGRVFADFD
jgi:hypothetical protein